MLLGGLHFLGAAEQELDDMMLQSPLTSTPFSVKDILKLEQQQQQSGSLELQHRPHTQQQLTGSPPPPPPPQQHFQTPPSCMLAGARDSPSFSDGEDNLAYLSALAVREEDRGETSLSPDMYVHPGLQGAKLEAAELDEQESSELKHRPDKRQQWTRLTLVITVKSLTTFYRKNCPSAITLNIKGSSCFKCQMLHFQQLQHNLHV